MALIKKIEKLYNELHQTKSPITIYIPITVEAAENIERHFPEIQPETFIVDNSTNLTKNKLLHKISKSHKQIAIIDDKLSLRRISQRICNNAAITIWLCNFIEHMREAHLNEGQTLALRLKEQFYQWDTNTYALKLPSNAHPNVIALALSLVMLDSFDQDVPVENTLVAFESLQCVVGMMISGAIINQLQNNNVNIELAKYYLQYGFHIDLRRFVLSMLQPGIRLSLPQPIITDNMLGELQISVESMFVFLANIENYYPLDKNSGLCTQKERNIVPPVPNQIEPFAWDTLINLYKYNIKMHVAENDLVILIANLLYLDLWPFLLNTKALFEGGSMYSHKIYNAVLSEFYTIEDLRLFVSSRFKQMEVYLLFIISYFGGRTFNHSLTQKEIKMLARLYNCKKSLEMLAVHNMDNLHKLTKKKEDIDTAGGSIPTWFNSNSSAAKKVSNW